MMNCPEVSLWIGQEDRDGHLTGVDGKPLEFAPWDMHSNVLSPGANDAMGMENCIKIRKGVNMQFNRQIYDTTGKNRPVQPALPWLLCFNTNIF